MESSNENEMCLDPSETNSKNNIDNKDKVENNDNSDENEVLDVNNDYENFEANDENIIEDNNENNEEEREEEDDDDEDEDEDDDDEGNDGTIDDMDQGDEEKDDEYNDIGIDLSEFSRKTRESIIKRRTELLNNLTKFDNLLFLMTTLQDLSGILCVATGRRLHNIQSIFMNYIINFNNVNSIFFLL